MPNRIVILNVFQLNGFGKYGGKIMEPINYTLKFPDMVMPKYMHDVLMNYTQFLHIKDRVHWTHVLHHTTYLGEFTETTDHGKFIYNRDYNELK